MSFPGGSRILVIDDDSKLQQRIGKLLAVAGFAVESALTASAGLLAAQAGVPALIVLGIIVPDGSGNDLCRSLRADEVTRAIPVLMLSVHGATADRVRGFEAGADDYVAKPYDGRELVLRIRALLRRAAVALLPVRMIRCGRLRIDRESFRAWVDEVAVALTALEFGLLLVLYDRRDRVQSRTRLLEDVWQASGSMLTSTVDTRIKLLRRKLRGAGPLHRDRARHRLSLRAADGLREVGKQTVILHRIVRNGDHLPAHDDCSHDQVCCPVKQFVIMSDWATIGSPGHPSVSVGR